MEPLKEIDFDVDLELAQTELMDVDKRQHVTELQNLSLGQGTVIKSTIYQYLNLQYDNKAINN